MPFWVQPIAVALGIICGAFAFMWFAEHFPRTAIIALAPVEFVIVWLLLT